MVDFEPLKAIVEWAYKNDRRGRRVVITFIMGHVFKIFSLILTTATIIYFLGCGYFIISAYLNSDYNVENKQTFVLKQGLDEFPNDFDRFITSSYYIITTLAVIGYGDLFPRSNIEKIFTILIMVLGVAFFSVIMGSFIQIVLGFDDLTEEKDDSSGLHQWLNLLNRFTKKKSIKRSLQAEIDDHFKHYWANNRLVEVTEKAEFMKALPRVIKKNIMVQFLYDDVFYKFKNFFQTRKYAESKFLYDISYNLKPR